jgi:transcriptional regulator
MKTQFEKRLSLVKRQASRMLKYDTNYINSIERKALNNVKNEFELDLWYEYRSSISTLSYNGDIAMRSGAIEAFKVQFEL